MTIPLTLPADPDLDRLKKQAKQLLRDARAQSSQALQSILTFHPRPAEFATLRDAQLTLARLYGFVDWEQLRNEVELRQLRRSSSQEQAERFIRHACLTYDGDDQPWRFERAAEWLRQLPDLSRGDFYCALAAGDLEAVTAFLRSDPSLAQRPGGPRNWPPLMYLTYSRVEQNKQQALAVARLLLEFGASPDSNSTNPSGFTALTGAVGGGEGGALGCPEHPCADALVRLLLDAGGDPNQSQALYNTMLGEHLGKWLKLFVHYGLKASDRANWTADEEEPIFDFLLCHQVAQGDLDLVRFLLERGANANAVSRYNHHAAHAVARLIGRRDIADLLEQFGARVEPLSIEDQFSIALHRDKNLAAELLRLHPQLLQNIELLSNCAMAGVETCLWLVGQGYAINTPNKSGQTVLHRYAAWNKPDAVAVLLTQGADPDAKEMNWHATALGLALHHHNWPVVDVLLPVSNNLLDICRVADSERAEKLLARDPIQVLERTPKGNTALHVVSQAKQDDPDLEASIATIELLLKYGADLRAQNNEGKTAAQWYRQLGMDEVADYMGARETASSGSAQNPR
jgi:ankyrin repeat protein